MTTQAVGFLRSVGGQRPFIVVIVLTDVKPKTDNQARCHRISKEPSGRLPSSEPRDACGLLASSMECQMLHLILIIIIIVISSGNYMQVVAVWFSSGGNVLRQTDPVRPDPIRSDPI
jgi:hypothetical protein